MKYNVSACINDTEYNYTVSCRWDANIETLFKKCALAVLADLNKKNVLPESVSYCFEKPNVWINGGVGAVWFENPFCNISIIRSDGCCIAL